jgi:asparagine synthase (glutamine-hydrolysing)
MKIRGLREKHILRQAMVPLLPATIGNRVKQPYRAPDSESFAGRGAPGYVAEMLSAEGVRAVGLFNPASVSRLAEKCRDHGALGFRDNAAFVGILSTQLWHHAFAGRRNSRAPAPELSAVI